MAKFKLKFIIPKEEKPSISQQLFSEFYEAKELLNPKKIWVNFKANFGIHDENNSIVIDSEGIQLKENKHSYESINSIKIIYNSEKYIEESDYEKYSRIEFVSETQKMVLYFQSSHKNVLSICKFWYDSKIKFKEYKNERRVFMGKRKTYSEIQKIKETYQIEW